MTTPEHRVFLSYARADDEAFVGQLHQDLVERGVGVWWDRKAMESRGRSFLQELRDAIEAAERVIAVIGPHAIQSAYVLAEWEHALLFCKGILPIIRLGERELIPPELIRLRLHCVDFRQKRPYAEALDELVALLAEPVPPLGAFLTVVPALPPHFLPRRAELTRLGEAVLADVQRPVVMTSEQQTTALIGMGGAGKSALAAAFARAAESRRAFADGIVWLRIGTKPNLLQAFRLLGAAFNDDLGLYVDEGLAAARLPRLLADKVCLIVLDDVWEVEHAASFVDILGPRCRLLVTTRDGGLADALGAAAHRLDMLEKSAALALLADWAGEELETLPEAAISVSEECGFLPLALAMAGAMVRGRPGRWESVLARLRSADLEKIGRKFRNYPYPNLLRAVEASAASLEPGARRRYMELAVFSQDAPAPEGTLARLWGESGLEAEDARDLMDLLVERSLAQRDSQGNLTLHDLLFDYARMKATNLPALHRRLLSSYEREVKRGCGWHTLEDDGYIYDNLIRHLEKAQLPAKIHELLATNDDEGRCAWWQARDQRGQAAGFVHDVAQAWRLADAGLSDTGGGAMRSDAIGLQVRYALMESSIASLAGNIPAELLATSLSRGVMVRPQALAYARQNAEPASRAAALTLLIPLLEEKQRKDLSAEVLSASRQTESPTQRVKALSQLALQVPEVERREMLEEALKLAEGKANRIASSYEDYVGAEALKILSPLLPADLFPRALVVARNTSRLDKTRAEAVIHLAPYLPESLLEELIALAMEIHWETDRAAALTACIRRLTPAHGDEIRHKALRAASKWVGWGSRKQLADLAPYLPDELLREALAMAHGVRNADYRAGALVALAPALTGELVKEAIGTARELEEENRAWALAALTPHAAGAERGPLIEEAVREAVRYPLAGCGVLDYVATISYLAPYLTRDLLQDAVNAAKAMEVPWQRAEVLFQLLPHLGATDWESVLDTALEAARNLEYDTARAQYLCVAADLQTPYPAVDLWREALQITLRQGRYTGREDELKALLPKLPGELLAEAARAVYEMEDRDFQALALAGLSPRLGEGQLREALRVARRIGDVLPQTRTLTAMLPFVSEAGKSRATQHLMRLAPGIRDAGERARAFAELAPHLSGDERDAVWLRAVRTLDEIAEESELTRVMAQLAPRFPELKVGDLLAAARKISDPASRANMLRALVSRVPNGERLAIWREVLDTVKQIEKADSRGGSLASMASLLPDALVEEALNGVRQQQYDCRDRGYHLEAFVQRLSEPLRTEVIKEAHMEARYAEMPYHLDDYQTFDWFRQQGPYLSAELLEETLRMARAVFQKDMRALALWKVAPLLPEARQGEVFEETLTCAMNIYDDGRRAEVLAEFPAHLTGEQIRKAAMDARSISNTSRRVRVFGRLAPHLGAIERLDLLREALTVLQEIEEEKDLAERLQELIPHLPVDLLPEALSRASGMGDANRRAGLMKDIALHLPEEQRTGALRAALAAASELTLRANERSRRFEELTDLFVKSEDCEALWTDTLHRLAGRKREDMLSDLAALAPVIRHIGGSQAIESVIDSVRTVVQWWP
jgi:hypothetical protein